MSQANPTQPPARSRRGLAVLAIVLALIAAAGRAFYHPNAVVSSDGDDPVKASVAAIPPSDPNLNGAAPIADNEPAFWSDLVAYAALNPSSRATANLWVSRFLDRHGRGGLAADHLSAGAKADGSPWTRVIALSMLRDKGIDPGGLASP